MQIMIQMLQPNMHVWQGCGCTGKAAQLAEKLVCSASESLGKMNVARVWLAKQFSAAV